ncbi:MAG TPA: signal peptidase II [Deinococcales bacterium]|nr:signal peptidase II [Deinococcales bacterium]
MRAWPFVVTALWVALDQWLKAYVVATLPLYASREVLPGFLTLQHVTNNGAAWSLFAGGAGVLTVVRLVAGVAILWVIARERRAPALQTLALALIAGGAFGNAIDGLFRGKVVDMLLSQTLTSLYQPVFHTVFPIFNLADTGVVGGVILLIIASLLPNRVPRAERRF